MLTLNMYETVLCEPLFATESLQIRRFSESTRKNMYYFPKYMDYRTKRLDF